ncbi:hypothetical protein PtA15_1A917 [Puccinia triticina]|uniref:Arrestin C-terminal-like domain-containing protein n=1 Tax=Puccinia triticina TaxID=208348 RepID=A0ABY7CCI1_9BASI|nr:uncharacterized protein PtA15_1A917 [Puccinia triticina]WAQ81575.1 hypothetical protein PtA15_1A917 [Puccinia triticina]
MDFRPSPPGQSFAATSSTSKAAIKSRCESVMPQCRPISLETSSVKVDCPLGPDVLRGSPLVIQCVNCFTTSTWFSPSDQRIRRDPAADVPPPLSTSSRSTSSEPSSINTDFFAETTLPSLTNPAFVKPVSTNLGDRLATPNESDGRTPVVGTFKPSLSDCPVSSTPSWTGGKLLGVCSSCSFRSDPCSTSRSVAAGSSSITLVPSGILPFDSNIEKLPPSHAVKPMSLLADSLATRYQLPILSTTFRDSSPFAEASSSLNDSDPNSQAPRTLIAQPSNTTAVAATDMLDQTNLRLSPFAKNNHLGLLHPINGNISPSPPSKSIPFPLKKMGASHEENSPIKHSNSLEPRPLNFSPTARTRTKSPRNPLREPDRKDMTLEVTVKGEGASSDSVERPDVVHRGANLRTLLREAKIPQSDSDESFSSGRRAPIAVDMWQAAMISTPRDRLRNANGDFPNWQVYSGSDSPFYQHLCGLSASTSSLSGKETLISTSGTSFNDHSVCGGSRSCSPPTDKHKNFEVHRRPSLAGRVAREEHADLVKASLKPDLPPTEAAVSKEQSTLGESAAPVSISQKLVPSPSLGRDLGSAPEISQSVPNLLINQRSSSSKRNAFYAAAPLAATSDRLVEVKSQRSCVENSLRLPPEDFQSKSRYFTVSISPRPTSATFSPGQRISVHVKLSNKVKVRKYTSIYLMLIGNSTSDGDSQPLATHDFLRHNYMIHPNPSDEVQPISHSGDLCEWHIELTIPGYANCPCQPGPLPLPSTGNHSSGDVSYSLQLNADRKQLLSNQESLSVKLHVTTQAEARYQVTTQPFRTQSRKGRIPFAGGYLGAVDELSLSHQVYYQSADRLRVGYQFELQLSSNSFLPPAIAEDVSKATKVEVHHLIKEQSKQCGLKFTDHRSKVVVIPSDDRGHSTKWIVKGFLEFKSVAQQMKAVRATVESTPRTPRRLETSLGARSLLSSSHGSMSPTGSGLPPSLQQETERQAKLTSSQLFLTVSLEHCPGVFTTSFEVSNLVGSELLSPCPLRKLGDEMMKRAVMAEKMKKVQEENSKNDRS